MYLCVFACVYVNIVYSILKYFKYYFKHTYVFTLLVVLELRGYVLSSCNVNCLQPSLKDQIMRILQAAHSNLLKKEVKPNSAKSVQSYDRMTETVVGDTIVPPTPATVLAVVPAKTKVVTKKKV